MTQVIRIERFEATVARQYGAARQKVFEKADALLKHAKICSSIAGMCNTILSEGLQHGITEAIGSGSLVVKVNINTAKAGKRLWSQWPDKLRYSVKEETVVLAIELLLTHAGFQVSLDKHLMAFELDLTPSEEPEEESEVVEEDDLSSAADDLSSAAPALADSNRDGAPPA